MKRICFSIYIFLTQLISFGQCGDWGTDFDPPYYIPYSSYRFYIDTLNNPNSKWQVGQPHKTVFDSAFSGSGALITDTMNTLPSNDTSYLYIVHPWCWQPFHVFRIHFNYKMDGDSTDFGVIELSPDKGITWMDYSLLDTLIWQYSWDPEPKLNGSTIGWNTYDVDLTNWAEDSGFFPGSSPGDTILIRFKYITDSNSSPREGWMIDDLYIEDWSEGIVESQRLGNISIFPNPVVDILNLKVKSEDVNRKIQILNESGKSIIQKENFNEDIINIRNLENGIYFLKYSDSKGVSVEKFIVQH